MINPLNSSNVAIRVELRDESGFLVWMSDCAGTPDCDKEVKKCLMYLKDTKDLIVSCSQHIRYGVIKGSKDWQDGDSFSFGWDLEQRKLLPFIYCRLARKKIYSTCESIDGQGWYPIVSYLLHRGVAYVSAGEVRIHRLFVDYERRMNKERFAMRFIRVSWAPVGKTISVFRLFHLTVH